MPTLDDEPREPAPPGDRAPTVPSPGESRRLPAPPSARYAPRATPTSESIEATSALRGPLLRATAVAAAGGALLTIVGAVLASTGGLLFAAGVAGAAIGLVLAGAAAPAGDAVPVPRARIRWVAAGLALTAVAAAAAATWVIARGEGGVLGPIDYLLTTFGPFVPAEAVIASLAAWWGASVGPIRG
ncbi:MAG TPA: hypothetical protein VFP56_02860 [Candidatus Limnocylindrales bacterium]|nr:hypothetical protein [Candidatus Limnocylindrales bacterium]